MFPFHKSLQRPERLPGFVHTTSKTLRLEMIRPTHATQVPENAREPVDERIDLSSISSTRSGSG